MFAFANYVRVQLGPEFTQAPAIEMKQVYRDTDLKTPGILNLLPLSSCTDKSDFSYLRFVQWC